MVWIWYRAYDRSVGTNYLGNDMRLTIDNGGGKRLMGNPPRLRCNYRWHC